MPRRERPLLAGKLPTEYKRATEDGYVNNHIAELHLQKKHQIHRDSATCITYSTDYYQRLTLERWFTNLEQTVVFSLGQFCLGKAGKVWKCSENTSFFFFRFLSRVTWALGMVYFQISSVKIN